MESATTTAARQPAADHDHGRCIDQALAQAATLCARRGARLTELRRRVLELVWQDHGAVKAYDILERLGADHGPAKPPTVYRALDYLIAHGLVHRLESLNAFVGCPAPERAHDGQFLICAGCGQVTELDAPPVRATITRAATAEGFAVERRTVEVHGLCRACQAQAEPR
jgi:Fur family zinc uptake transcriptional regulator